MADVTLEMTNKNIEETETFVPNWLIEVLAWINRIEMANSSLSFSCKLFKQLCWPKLHENVARKFVKPLRFTHQPTTSEFDNFQAKLMIGNYEHHGFHQIPIASVPPPTNYIVAFKSIEINFFDAQVLQFIRAISPLINSIKMSFDVEISCFYGDQRIGHIYELLQILATENCEFHCDHFANFLRFYPQNLLANVRTICSTDDKIDVNLLFKWLTKSTDQRRPKLLKLFSRTQRWKDSLIDKLKKEFPHSTKPATFMIQIGSFRQINLEEFTMENAETEEQLALYQKPCSNGFTNIYIVRHAMGGEKLRNESEQQMQRRNCTEIRVKIDEIGQF